MFGIFKKGDNNLNWSIEKVYNDPEKWFKDISKEQRLKTFAMKYVELDHIDKDQGLTKDNIVIMPTKEFEDFKLFENFVSAQISLRNKRLGLNKNFWILKPGESIESNKPDFYPKNIVQKIPKHEDDNSSIDKNPYGLKEGMIREYILQKQTMSIHPFNEETQQYKEAISYNILFSDYLNQEDYENREPIIDQTLGERQNIGINEIDQKVKYDIVLFEGKIIDYDQILDDHNDSDFEELDLFESLENAINFRDELISEHLNEKPLNENESHNNEEKEDNILIYDTEDVRKLLVQLSGSDPEIKLSVSDTYFGAFQLEKDLSEQEFNFVDAQEYQDFDPKKPAYTGTTIYREYECYVSKSVLIDYLKEYIESSEFNEDEMDLDSFLRWGDFEHGHSFEHELDGGEIEEVIDVQGKEVYLVSIWEMDEHRDRHMIIEFNDNSGSQSPEVEEKLVDNPIQSIHKEIKTHNFCSECGNKLLPEMKFCTQCGKKIDDISSSKVENPEHNKNHDPTTERFQIESLKGSFNKSIDNVYNKFLKHSRDLHIHFDQIEYDKIKPILANLYYMGIKLATISDKDKKDQYQSEIDEVYMGNICHERLLAHFLEENRSWNSKIKLIKIILMDKPDFLELVFNEIFTENNNEILELIKSKKFGIPFDDGEKWDVRFKVFSQKAEYEYSKEGEENIIVDNIDSIMYRGQAYDGDGTEWVDFDGGLSEVEFYIKNGEKYNPSEFLSGNSDEWTQENYTWMIGEDQKTYSYHKTEEEAKKALNELFEVLVINKEKFSFPDETILENSTAIYVFQEKRQRIELKKFRFNGLILSEIEEVEYRVWQMQESFNISEMGFPHMKEDFSNMMITAKHPGIVDLKFYFTMETLFGSKAELISNLNRNDFEDYIDREEFISRETSSFQDKWYGSCKNCGQDRLFCNFYECPNCGKSNPQWLNFNYA